jgi:hypothetical protein
VRQQCKKWIQTHTKDVIGRQKKVALPALLTIKPGDHSETKRAKSLRDLVVGDHPEVAQEVRARAAAAGIDDQSEVTAAINIAHTVYIAGLDEATLDEYQSRAAASKLKQQQERAQNQERRKNLVSRDDAALTPAERMERFTQYVDHDPNYMLLTIGRRLMADIHDSCNAFTEHIGTENNVTMLVTFGTRGPDGVLRKWQYVLLPYACKHVSDRSFCRSSNTTDNVAGDLVRLATIEDGPYHPLNTLFDMYLKHAYRRDPTNVHETSSNHPCTPTRIARSTASTPAITPLASTRLPQTPARSRLGIVSPFVTPGTFPPSFSLRTYLNG